MESNHPAFSGTGFVNYDNLTGSYVEWLVNAPAAGGNTLTVRFANGTTTNRPMDIAVNGALVADDRSFPSTGTWSGWQTVDMAISLAAGDNVIRATAVTVNGGPNVDYIAVDLAAPPPEVHEAESVTPAGCAVETEHTGFTGTG